MRKKTCSAAERNKQIERILRKNKQGLKPGEICEQLNVWLTKQGYKTVEQVYMSRIQSPYIEKRDSKYYYNTKEKLTQNREGELQSLLKHFRYMARAKDYQHQLLLQVDIGYEKVIASLIHKLFDDVFVIDGVGCVMLFADDEVLDSPAMRKIKAVVDEFEGE